MATGGGAIYKSYACLPTITNSTFSENKVTFPDIRARGGAAIVYNNPNIPNYDTAFSGGKITNCIFWDNIAPTQYNANGFQEVYVSEMEGPLTVSNSLIQGYGVAGLNLHYTAISESRYGDYACCPQRCSGE